MEATVEATKVIKFSNLKDIEIKNNQWHTQIPVKRSDSDRCIYKAFTDMDNLGIYLTASKQSSRSFLGIGTSENIIISADLYELKPKHENQIMKFNEPEIELILDEKVQVLPVRTEEGSHRSDVHILIKSDKGTKLKVDVRRTAATLKEKDGKFFVDHNGVWFDAKPFVQFYKDPNAEDVFNSLKYFPAKFEDRDQKNRFLAIFIKDKSVKLELEKTNIEGISKTLAVIQPFYDELIKTGPQDVLGLISFKLAMESSKRTINNVKFSVIINKIFSEIKTKESFLEKIKELSVSLEATLQNTYRWDKDNDFRTYQERVMDSIPEARDIKKAALKRKSTGAINKIMDDLDFISIDKDKYPLTHEAIFSGEIPKGTFFRKNGDSYFVYNDNWELWEEMLALHYDVAKSIAEEASKRTTYEKDLMSYFYFVLHKLPEYLEAHTGRKWKGIPKLVSSENELDPPTEGSNGVSKQRSALTPIADNEKNEVVIPYVSMVLSGYQNTYCYGLDYNVLDRGLSFNGNTVTKSVEKNLNGRDDYGLMFYTLTGSHNGRGYPTFLIIFEQLDKTIKVHFHRTHPMRSKGGDYNPIHGWTVGCYKWMVGNVNFERIKAQQGDLVFVQTNIKPEHNVAGVALPIDFAEVNAYDNHKFETPVNFLPYTKKEKSNILGYFRIEKDTMLNHHEHKPRLIPAGDYELRQCRSWEANPKGVWSLRID